MKYKVVEIFDSIDGEGKRSGQPVSFVRLAGCNLRCSYCDTLYSLFGEEHPCEYSEMTADEILKNVNENYKRITLTGGEPLISGGINNLINLFAKNGYEVNIETNGACDISPYVTSENVFVTIDYKLPSSGMTDKMLLANYSLLRKKDVLKFVVGSDEDASYMIDVIRKIKKDEMPQIYVGAVYGAYDNEKLTELVMNTPELFDAKIQIQLHKYIGAR